MLLCFLYNANYFDILFLSFFHVNLTAVLHRTISFGRCQSVNKKQLVLKDMNTLTVRDPTLFPQNQSQFDSGVTTVLLIEAQPIDGVEAFNITPNVF